jgi:outer membrane protein insertion porin family
LASSSVGLRLGLLLATVFTLFSGAAHAQLTVSKIIITNVGPAAASEALVRANIRAKIGEPYNRAVIDDDIRMLYNTGYFLNIRVVEERAADGVALTYVVQGKPRITDINFVGNKKYNARKLRKTISTKVGDPVDERKLFTDEQEIKKLYQKSGYPETKVEKKIYPDERAGRATVTFEIQEAPKVRITNVHFDGATAFSQKKLRRQVKTRKWWMFSWLTGSGKLKQEQLEEDKDKLAEFYRNEGYIDFELKDVRYLWDGPRRITVQFVVHEGRQYKVGAVAFKGVTLFTTNELKRAMRMDVGSTFTPRGLSRDLEALQDVYGAKGYIDTRIIARKNANPITGTMDLVYEFSEGDKSYIEKVEIKGNIKTKDRVIRRELSVAPGEVFDMTKVKLSKQRLEGTRLFERIETQPEPTEVPNRKNLVVSVDEAETGHLSFGAGFSSVDSILGFVEYRESNFQFPWFRGGGQKLRLRASVGALRRDYQISFIEPWFLGRKLELGVDAYHRELDFVSENDLYNERRTGTRFGLRKALGSDFLIGGISYTIENIGIIDVDEDAPPTIQEEEGDRLVSKTGYSLAYDTRKYNTAWSGFLPVSGQNTEFRSELAGGPFGAETDFYKLEFGSKWYFKGPFQGHVLEVEGRIGTVDSYADSDRVPFFDRFFLGGLDTLRGYRYRQVGPREVDPESGEDERIGGNTFWYATVEYSVPIIEFLRFAVFYDIGMVYPDAWSLKEDPFTGFYNDNWGVGVRLNIPRLGPLRLDYGIPITSDDDNRSSGRFQFTVGYERPF